jgi:hypothetical protein
MPRVRAGLPYVHIGQPIQTWAGGSGVCRVADRCCVRVPRRRARIGAVAHSGAAADQQRAEAGGVRRGPPYRARAQVLFSREPRIVHSGSSSVRMDDGKLCCPAGSPDELACGRSRPGVAQGTCCVLACRGTPNADLRRGHGQQLRNPSWQVSMAAIFSTRTLGVMLNHRAQEQARQGGERKHPVRGMQDRHLLDAGSRCTASRAGTAEWPGAARAARP